MFPDVRLFRDRRLTLTYIGEKNPNMLVFKDRRLSLGVQWNVVRLVCIHVPLQGLGIKVPEG